MACKFEAHNGVDSRLHKKLVDNFKSKDSQLAKLGKEFSQDVNYESQADDLYAYVHGPAFKEWFGDFTKEDLPNTDENGEPKLFKSQGQFYFERQDGAREYITGTDSLFSIEEQKQIFEAIRFKFLENLKEDDKSSLISFISKSENLKQTLSDKNINDVVQALIDDVLEDAENLTDHQITMLERLANSKKAFDDFANQLRKFYSKIGIDFSKESSLNQDEDGNDLDETTSKDLDFSPSVESNPIKNASRALKVYLNHIPKGQIVNGQFQPINDSVLNAGTYESYGAVHKTLIRMFADTIQGDLTIDEYVDEFINKLRENQNELAWAGKIADDLQSMKDNKDLNALKQFIVGLNTHYYNYMLSTFNDSEVKYFSTSATESNVGRLLTRWNVSIINTAELDLNALTNVVESTSSLQKQAKELIENGNSEAAVNLFVNNIVDGLQALNVDVKPKAVRDLLKDEKYLGGETELNRALTLSKFFDSFVTDLKSKQEKDEFYQGGETENKMVNIIKDNIFIRKLAEKQIVFIGEDINESVQRPKGQSYSYSKPSHIKDKLLFILNAKSGKSYINDLQTRSYYKYSKWLEYLDSDNADNVSIDMMSHFKEERVGDAGKDNKDIKIADELTMNIAMMLGRDEQGNPITPSFRTITAGDKSRAFHIKGFEVVQSMFETGQLSEEVIERAMGYLNAELERVIEVQGEIDAIENPEEGRAPVEKIMHYNTGLKNGLRVYFMPELSYEFYREAVEKEPNERSPEETAIADLDKTIKAITKAAGLEERGLYNEKGRLLFGPNYTNEKVADSKKVAQDIQNAIKLTLGNFLMDKVTAGVEEMRSFYKYPGNEQGVVKLDKKVQSFYSKNRPGSQGDAVLGDYFINQMFANVEYTKMYTGDPAYYKNVSDFNKRVQGTYIDGDKGVFEDGNETFTIAVTESIEESSSQDILDEYEKLIGSKVKSYNKNNVADAQAWISLGRWISIENSLGRWSDKHEEIFNKISKDPKAELTKEEVKFVLDNHPPQSMKGVYFDVDKNGRPTYLKYSQAVLIPQLTQGSPILEKLVDKMTENKIDEVITSDGIKVGAPADIFDKNLDGEFGTLKLKATSWRLQQDLPTKGIKDQDVGSQIMKNILANVDPENNYDVNGQPLTGKQLTNEIFRVINKMSNYGSNKLKAKLFDSDGNIRKDQINKIILDNLEDPDENLISALKRNVDYDSLPQFRVPIMNAIFAEVRKSIRPKTKGIGAIQVSAFGFERITDKSQIVWLKDATTDEDKVLDPPSEKNGYKGDVLISGSILNKMIQNTEPGKTYKDFIDYDSEGNIISTERLFGVNGVLGELKDFGAIGYRIPNQGLSSNDALNIAGILPDIAGDIVVPYKEITTKTGSDFDIDKMYMMFKDVNPPLIREDVSESDKELIDELTETIFEEDDFKAKYVTAEEFENIQDANRLIDLYLSILTSENTIEQIITPLDSDDLRKDIRKVAPEQTVNMFDPIENLKLKHKLKGGKNNVGGNANHLVNILYAQLGESQINSDLGVGHMENGVTLLNRFKDANTNEEKQEFITKTLSDFLTAFVDIGKDAYVVDANYNTKTANIAFMLLRAGATKEWVTRFLKQPAIEMLLKEIEVQDASIVGFVKEENRPFNKVKERILDQARANLSKAAVDRLSNLDADDATINTRNNFKIKRLTDNITDPSKNDNYYEDQITALVMFEKYKGLAQNLADFNQSMRSDVNGAGRDYSSLLAIKNTIAKVQRDNVISGLEEVFENTQVGTFYRNSVVVAQDIVNQLFNIGKTDGVVDTIGYEMMGSYITDEETIFQIHNSLYTFFHRTGAFEINEEKQDALFKDQQGSPSLATRIYNLQKLQKREGFNQEGKFLIDSLVVNFEKIGADKVRHGFIQLPSSTKSGSDFRQNIYESWLELLKSNDPRFRKIGEDLIQYGFYSTGFQKTLGSIYEFIPNEWFFRNNHTSSVQTKFDDFDRYSEEAGDFVYKANMFENKFVPRLSQDQVKSIEQIADISRNKSFKIDIKDPRRFVKIVDKNGSILLFKLRGLDETGKAIYAREATIREKIGSVYRFKFPDNPNMLTPKQNAFVDSLVVEEEDTSSPSEDKDDVINDVTAAVDDAQTTEQPISQTPVQPTQQASEVEAISERVSKLKFSERINALIEEGIIASNLTYNLGKRFPVILNINGTKVAFYRSSEGTGGKEKGAWTPMFGFGEDNGNPWLIKGDIETQVNKSYDNTLIKQYENLLNNTLNWDHSLDKGKVKDHPFFKDLNLASNKEAFNNELYGVEDLGIVNGESDVSGFIESKLKFLQPTQQAGKTTQQEGGVEVKKVYHHTSVSPQNFNFRNFQRGKNQVSQFGDGLNAATETNEFFTKKYGQPIEGEVNDKDFVEIDANLSESEIYDYLTGLGYKINTPQYTSGKYNAKTAKEEYDGVDPANDDPSVINLFNDFQQSNPEVKGVKVVNHIIGNKNVAPFYVIYDSKSFYGPGSLSEQPTQQAAELVLGDKVFNPDISEANSYPIRIDGKYAGVINVDDEGKIISSIGMAGIGLEPEFRKKGFGKRAYIALNEKINTTLRSEDKSSLNENSEGVWKSLVRSKLAEDVGNYYKFKETLEGTAQQAAAPKKVLLEAEADIQTAEQYLPNMQLGDTFEILFSSEPGATYKKANLVDFNAGQQTSGDRMELGLFIEGESTIRKVSGVMFSNFPDGSVKIKSLKRKSLPEASPNETDNINNCKGQN